MASHGNFSMPLNCEAFLSDPDVVTMELGELGLYVLLLMQSWVNDDGGLPNDTNKLRKLGRCDKQEWDEYSPAVLSKFYKKGKRIYNKRLLEELDKLNARRENGRKGGKAKPKQNASETQAKDKQNTSGTLSKNQHPEPEPELELKTINTTSRGEENRISSDSWKSAGGFEYESVIKNNLPVKDWERSGHFFLWCFENLNHSESIEILQGFKDRMDPVVRKTKGYTAPKSAGAYLRSEFQKLAERMGIGRLPADSQAKYMRAQKDYNKQQ